MEIEFSDHSLKRMKERGLSKDMIRTALESPDKVEPSIKEPGRFLAKKVYFNEELDKDHLLMIIFKKKGEDIRVITVIDTSKISKYL